jgi:nitroreductase
LGVKNEDLTPKHREEFLMEYENLLELVKKRRSVRRFRHEAIPDDYIEKIIEVARHAPSGFNTQPWEFIVVKDKELRNKIVDLLPQSDLTAENDFRIAPVYIIELGDPRTKIGLPKIIRDNKSMHEPIFVSTLANSFIYMNLAATSLGLSCQWVSMVSFPYVQSELKKLIGIPDLFKIYDMLALGYAAAEPEAKLFRDIAGMVHYDYCMGDEFRTDEEVSTFAERTHAWTTAQHKR